MEREKIGIKGIDSMIQGGLPKGSVISITGPPGIGKSLFAIHFLLEGARKGQKCIYINLEEPLRNIENMFDQFKFGNEFKKYMEQKKIIVKCFSYEHYDRVYSDLIEKIKEDSKIKRFVIDSFNGFISTVHHESLLQESPLHARIKISNTFHDLREMDLTTVLVLEKEKNQNIFYNIPYLVDGIIQLKSLQLGTLERRIFIPKMRWTNQYKESKNYDIRKIGIKIIEEKE